LNKNKSNDDDDDDDREKYKNKLRIIYRYTRYHLCKLSKDDLSGIFDFVVGVQPFDVVVDHAFGFRECDAFSPTTSTTIMMIIIIIITIDDDVVVVVSRGRGNAVGNGGGSIE
jgi:hypothetical protein